MKNGFRIVLLASVIVAGLTGTAMLRATAADTAPPAATGGEARASTLSDLSQLDSRKLASDPETWPGAQVYRSSCSNCHEGQVPKAPHKMFLQMLSGATIHEALTTGLMQTQAAALSASDRQAVAEYLSGAALADQAKVTPVKMCAAGSSEFDAMQAPQRSGWGYHNSRYVPAAQAGITAAQAPKLRVKWALEFPGALRARSQPALAFGAVFVGSHDGTVYSLDQKTGCARWTFKAGAEVRTAVVPYQAKTAPNVRTMPPRLFFGDVIARVYSIDATTGKLAWSAKVDDHANATITGTPTIHNGVIYVPVSSLEVTSAADPKYECCKFRGAIVAFDAWSGRQLWKSWTIPQEPRVVKTQANGTRIFAPSGAPVWNSPMIDARRGVLYVGTGENYSSPADNKSDALIAFRLGDGKQLWSRQMVAGDAWNVGCMMAEKINCPPENGPDVDFGAGTILVKLPGGREILVAGQKNGVVYGLDPDKRGAVLWRTRVGRGGIQGGIHFGMAVDGTRIYAPVSDMTDGRDGRAVTGPPRPGLYAINALDGKLLWSAPAANRCGDKPFCDPGISAAITAAGDVVYAGHMDGRFRAYDGKTGDVLLDFDALQPVQTVSGTTAHGGSFGGGGAAVRDGLVVVNSGYGMYFHMPGNVMLAFSAQ